MQLLLLTHAFNSLAQRLFVELRALDHIVSVEFDINDHVSNEAVELFQPDLIIAPFLKRAIPESIWRYYPCLIVHPGIVGDRGPSSLDWAILKGKPIWGVTVLQATAEMDGGPVWAHSEYPMRSASKASLYRHEVTESAVQAVTTALQRYRSGKYKPEPQGCMKSAAHGSWQPCMRQVDRRIEWERDSTQTILRKMQSADGSPGVLDQLFEHDVYLYDAQVENKLRGLPGEIIARSGPAVCRATVDGAIWIGHVRISNGRSFKLPTTHVFKQQLADLPEIKTDAIDINLSSGYREIHYIRRGQVGYLYFQFYNGTMSVDQCRRLLEAYRYAIRQPTCTLMMMGGPDFWSNGMHLNLIEVAESAADESLRNIHAIDDLVEEIIRTTSQLTIAVMQGNAGAGGVFLARACDLVWARSGIVINPHYKDMGNLYGSEYWTYLLPRFAGEENAQAIADMRLPMGMPEAVDLGLVDRAFDVGTSAFLQVVDKAIMELIASGVHEQMLRDNYQRILRDESTKPLKDYRAEELEQMKMNFYGFDPSYHVARYNFVYKVPKSRTPLTLAIHRRQAGFTPGNVMYKKKADM